jgi:hypothetical protein
MLNRKLHRCWCMLNAYLTFNSRKDPKRSREIVCWLLLLEWASLGGTQDEVIRG